MKKLQADKMKLMIILQDTDENLLINAKKIDGIADIIWFRIKNNNEEYIYKKAEDVRKIVKKSMLILSPYPQIALQCGYDGIQMNKNTAFMQNDYKNLIKGYSAHTIDEINNIKADFYTFSPVFYTPKEYEVKPAGLISMPKDKKVFALGGIKKEHIELARQYGFYGIAGIRLINEYI